ncbi:hypothetical protein B0E53_06927 [Micromonospora sp. MH33]|nr:hypothetical protein B0E53_06927 [Micromonospora sp. MH33]
MPWPARASYQPVRSASTAPAGGHAPRPLSSAGSAAVSTPSACRSQSPSGSWSGWACTATGRQPASSRGPTRTWTRTAPCAGSTSGAAMVSSRTWQGPNSSPARSTSSTSAVPGTMTWPATTWSASHGWADSDSRPVSTAASSPASRTAAASSGWPAAPRPARETSEVRPAGRSQNRSPAKAYVGRSTRVAAAPAKTGAQSTATPAAKSSASPVSRARASGRPRRWVATAWASPVSVSRISAVRTLCGPISRNVSTPASRRAVTPSAKRTASRTCRTQ